MAYEMNSLSRGCTITAANKSRFSLGGMSLLSLLTLNRQRRQLAELDDAALTDMGITRAQAQQEAARPMWQVPHSWLR